MMSEDLAARALYAAMAAVLVIPEPATFLVFLALFASLAHLLMRFAWSLLLDFAAEPAIAPE